MNRALPALVVLILALLGCVPAVVQYYRLEYPGASRGGSGCAGGPPAEISFNYHGVNFAVDFNPEGLQGSFFVVRVPEGHTAQLASASARIVWDAAQGPTEALVELRLLNAGSASPTSELLGSTYKKTYLFASTETIHRGHIFVATTGPLEPKSERGTIFLPALRIDGTGYPGPEVPFKRSSYAYIAALNC